MWAGSLAFWTFVGTLFVLQELVYYRATGRGYALGRVLAEHGIEWGTWAVLTPVLMAFVVALPPTTRPARRTAAVYMLAATAATVASVGLIAAGRYALPWHDPRAGLAQTFVANLARLFAYSVVLFVLVAALGAAFAYYRDARERELAGARLESNLASARIDALTMQLQPHFLFNTLNTIAGLVRVDPRKADRMITGLGDLLRTSLQPDRPALVTLDAEVAFVTRYLEIQQTRFDERLTTVLDIPDELRRARVPTFLLQPLVENAIQHAVAVRSTPVTVTVSARREDDLLVLIVRDDGPGIPSPVRGRREGIGVANTRARLAQLYGGRQRLEIGNHPAGGAEARVSFPFETGAA